MVKCLDCYYFLIWTYKITEQKIVVEGAAGNGFLKKSDLETSLIVAWGPEAAKPSETMWVFSVVSHDEAIVSKATSRFTY